MAKVKYIVFLFALVLAGCSTTQPLCIDDAYHWQDKTTKVSTSQSSSTTPSTPNTPNTQNADDLAAVAYALHLAQGKEHKEGIITLPEIHPTAWNHKHYVLK